MKVCSKCKEEKELSYFDKDKRKKDGHRSQCKKCIKEYYLNNKEYYKEYKEKYKEKYKEYYKERYKNNKEKNKEYYKEYRKEYYKNNKEKHKEYCKEYIKNRMQIDPLFKLKCNIRSLIRTSIKNKGFTKSSQTYNILGCTYEEFKKHLENQFTKGMNWENQGEWHLDHIYPVSLAKDEEELYKLNHYTNFQPLWAEDNLKKGNKVIEQKKPLR
jgi:hypothetical protein